MYTEEYGPSNVKHKQQGQAHWPVKSVWETFLSGLWAMENLILFVDMNRERQH